MSFCSRSYFNEYKGLAILSNEIDLAASASPIPFRDPKALLNEEISRQLFSKCSQLPAGQAVCKRQLSVPLFLARWSER
ncbi:MAG: hypothetical protein K0R67_2554 [Paenibacillus sp.]|nr:hypothetical protein [Paenibacillus sp.]